MVENGEQKREFGCKIYATNNKHRFKCVWERVRASRRLKKATACLLCPSENSDYMRIRISRKFVLSIGAVGKL